MKKFHINLAFFALSFYCYGAGTMDGFVIYDGWRYVGENEFAAMHLAMGHRIIALFVWPMILLLVLNILQYWFRPAAIPRSWVTMALAMQIIGWLSSIFIQIPMQFQLDKGKDEALLEKLILSDWIRVFAWSVYIIVVIVMLYRINKAWSPINRRKVNI